MNTIQICDEIELGIHRRPAAEVTETLARRYRELHEAAQMAELLMSQTIQPRQGVSEFHPWSILEKLRSALAE